MLSPDALRLEELRQQIQDMEWEINADHLDYVREQKPTKKVIKLREQSKAVRAQLRAAIEAVRREKPAAFAEWVDYHTSFLKRIQAETSTEMNADTRRGMAGSALQQWEKVFAGEQEFVYINQHFLKDYSAEVSKGPRQNPTSTPEEAESARPWWQFWK